MNVKFCPDCQEECSQEDLKCPECEFPLRLTMTASGNRRTIERSELDDWKRIEGILRRNGIKIESRPSSSFLTHGLWWALPLLGVLSLVTAIFMGPSLVDRIWEPQVSAPPPVLDLNQAAGTLPEEEEDSSSASFLSEALKVSDKQKQLTQDLNLDLEQYIDKVEVSQEVIRSKVMQTLLELNIRDRKRRGVLLNSEGLFLAPITAVADAFRNEMRTITENGNITQENVYVEPMVNLPGKGAHASSKVKESQAVELVLLKASLKNGPNFSISYDTELEPNETVWVGRFVAGKHYLEEALVIESHHNVDDVLFWVLNETQLGPRDSGAPVFNRYGELAGVLIYQDEKAMVLSMLRLREKAPTLYKYVK